MPIMPDLKVPTYVAYFTVFVPLSHSVTDSDRAREVVGRYLYQGEIVKVEQRMDVDEPFRVLVRVETIGDSDSLVSRLGNQRDRFLSGMYRMSEPVFLGHTSVG